MAQWNPIVPKVQHGLTPAFLRCPGSGDVFGNVRFSLFFHDLPLSENANMPAYLPQSRIVKKDIEKAERILLQTTEPKVTGSNPVGCTFKSSQVFLFQ